MTGLWKKGAFALVLGAALGVSGVATADVARPKPAVAADNGKGPEKANAKGADNAAKGAENAAGKPEDKGKADEKGKGDEKSDKDKDGGTGDAAAAEAPAVDEKAREAKQKANKEKRDQRKAKAKDEREAAKKKVSAALKGQPMAQAMKQELERHARRLARLWRVKELADEGEDKDAVGRVDKLIEKENARHDKWMANYDAKAAGAKPGDKAGDKADKPASEKKDGEK
jgi:hypothetical protein